MKPIRLTALQQVWLGLLSFPISLAVVSVLTFVPTYYAIDLGLGLTAVGLIFALGRSLDVLTDPIIGHFSDATRSPWGKRLPWMVLGIVILCPSLYFVMTPIPGLSALGLGLIVAIFFLGLTIIDLPYSAVGLEISPFKNERTIIAAVKAAFQIIGALVASALIVAFSSQQAVAFNLTAFLVIAFILLGLVCFLSLTPYRNEQESSVTPDLSIRRNIRRALSAVRIDADFKRILLAFGLAQAGSATSVGLTALLVLKLIGAPELTGGFIVILLITTALALPFWVFLSKRIGKAQSWRWGLLTGSGLMFVSFLFIGENVWTFALFSALFGFVVAADVILPTTLLADLVSDRPTPTDHNQAGMMQGLKNAVSKAGFVVPMLVAFPLLGALNVEAAETLNPTQKWALLGLYGFLPAGLRCLSWGVMRRDLSIETGIG